jgi:ABC-type branched-subunit amino acid transport system ATPase component
MNILKINNIHKRFGGIYALDDCTLNIKKGTITAIIGPNGSGKTTLFNVISKLIEPDEGDIIFNGKNITKWNDYKIARHGISRTFQEVRLFRNLTIKDHIGISLSTKDESMIYSFFNMVRNSEKKIQHYLDIVGLKKDLNTYATDLSYGQRKLLDLALAIAKPHKLLMLDEPVAGVNPLLREEIKNILKSLRKQGETILVIEHDMNFVMDLADEIFVLNEGKVMTHGKPKDIQHNKKVLDAYLGE